MESSNMVLAIRDEEMPTEGAFKCKWCLRAFNTARARGGHQKAHSKLPEFQEKKKANKGRRRVFSPPCSYATALRSAYFRIQPFAEWGSHYDPSVRPRQTGTSTGSLVAALAAGGAEDGGRLGGQQDVGEVGQEEPANGIDLTLKL